MLIMSSLNEKLHLKLNVSKYRDVAPFPIEGKGLGFGVCESLTSPEKSLLLVTY